MYYDLIYASSRNTKKYSDESCTISRGTCRDTEEKCRIPLENLNTISTGLLSQSKIIIITVSYNFHLLCI